MATADLLSSFDDETKLRIVAGLLSGGTLTDQQKTYFLEITRGALQQFSIESNVKEYVTDHPDYLLERMFAPINTKKFQDGKITIGTQESMAKALSMAFNSVNGKETDMWNITDDMQEDFLSGNWLHDVPTVDSAMKKRNSRGKSRRAWYDACKQLCRVFEITDSDNQCDWPAITKQYELLIKFIDFGFAK